MALARLRLLLPALWAGMLLCVALVATPAPFAVLAAADAGRVVGQVLASEAAASLVAAMVFLLLERKSGGAASGRNTLLALAALFCTVAGYYCVQPFMAAARMGQGALTFGQLHLLSVAFFAAKLLLVLALAWRVSAAARPS